MKHLGDITAISGFDVPPVDVVIGGSPCQDLSIAGKREGLAGARSGLFMEQVRIVKEMRNADIQRGRTGQFIRPRFMVWENVPGAFSSNKGEDFRAVLEETIRIAEPDAPDIPLPPKGKWPLADAWYGDGWSVAYRVLDAQFWGVAQRRRRVALVADFGGWDAPEILFVRNSVCRDSTESGTQREETAAKVGGGAEKAGIGTAVNIFGHEVIPTLVSSAFKGPENTQDGFCIYDARGNGDGKTCCTLTGDHQSRVTDYTAIVCENLTPGENQARRIYGDSGVFPALSARENAGQNQQSVFSAGAVRRPTPLECERLQGFPDGWTDIGPWTDSAGKLHKESSDSARYKALGNSIALPPWKWILKRLCSCYERDATMASLFDGIGGFPLIWEGLNGPGTCLWSSEIEEFPIAVTKFRFKTEGEAT